MDARFGVLILIVGGTTALYPGLCKPDADNACKDYSSADKCQLMEYCKANVWSHTLVSESKLCQICKTDIANVQKFVSANTTREYVKYDLLALCRACPFSAGRKKCLTIVNDNFDKIYDDIISKLDPNTICRGLHICRASDDKEDKDDIDMKSLGPLWLPGPVQIEDNICFTAEKCSSYSTAVKCGTLDLCKEYVWSMPVQTNAICDECKAEIKKVHDWVADNKTEDEVKKELLMFCDRIPIQSLQQKDANIICSALGLCVPSYEVQIPSSCELDVSHACLDYASAAHCNTLNYCQYVVWNAPIEDSKLCKCCLDDIDNLRKYLDSNRTRERVEADFLALCKLLPWQSMKFKCQTTVLHNFERIYQDVINYLNSTVICRSFFLCRNQGQDDALAEAFLNVMMRYDDSAGCRFCKDQIKALQDWIKSSPTKQSIEKKLHSFCDHIKLTAFRDEVNLCQSMINEHFDKIYYDLISDTDPDVLCKKLKICGTNSQNKLGLPIPSKSCTDNDPCSDYNIAKKCGALSKCKSLVWSKHVVKGDDVCRFCEGEIRALQEFVKDNATESEVKQRLNTFCNNMKLSAFKDECLSFMSNNFDDLYADLVALLDPSTVCTYLKLCNQITSKLEGISTDVAASCPDELACNNYKTAIKCGKLEKCKATVWAVPTVKDSNVCTLCKEEIAVLQNWMKSKPVADEVKAALNSFCDAIPLTAFRDECKDNVESGFDEIYADLANLVDKSVICTGLKLCESISTEKYMDTMMDRLPDLLKKAAKQHKLPIRAPLEPTAATSCKKCEAFVDDFQNIVFNNNEIMIAMLQLIKPECESLDGNGAMCDMITYQMTMEHGRQPANTATVCKATNMCNVGDKFTDDMCSNCKAFFKQLQEEMKSNPTIVGEIIHAASEVYCLRKSSELRQQDVAIICQRVQFCDITHMSKVIVEKMPRHPALVEGDPCADCKAFVSDLQTAIKNNDPIVAQLVNLVEGQCRALGELSTLCVDYIKGHYQDVLNKFAALTLDQACDAMRMCPKSQNAVNGDICTDCKAFFGDLQSMIINNRSVINQDLADLRTAICDEVPSILRGECDKVFDKESGVIVTALSSQTPEQTCSDTLFCDNGKDQSISLTSNVEIQSVESGVKVPGVCAVCEAVMKYVDSYIDYNSTEKEIETLLLDACAHLPEYGKQCDDFVKKYVDTIVKLILEEGTSPLVVCKVLGLCAAPPSPKKTVHGPAECDVCMAVFTEIQHVLADKVVEICSVIGKYKTECELIINDYGPTILKVFANEVDPSSVCKLIKLCQPSQAEKIAQEHLQEEVGSGVLCEVCTLVADQLDKMLTEKSTQTEIENALEAVCGLLPQEFKDTCDDLVTANFKKIVDFLVKEMNPKVLCVELKLCPAQAEIESALQSVCSILPQQFRSTCDDFISTNFEKIVAILVKEMNPKVICVQLGVCPAQAEIKNALDTVCSFLPADFKATCDNLIDSNFDKIMQMLVDEMNPKVICVQLKVCAAKVKSDPGIVCGVCTLVANELDKTLSDKAVQADIENALNTVCDRLPAGFKTTCDNLIKEYFDEIINFLVHEMNPKVLCVQLHICPALVAPVDKCEVCKLATGAVDDFLKEPDTSAAFEAALKELCDFLPADAQLTCKGIMDESGKEIFSVILKEMVPDVFCGDMGFCQKISEKPLAGKVCDVCQLIAAELETLLSNNMTKNAIESALKSVCYLVPQQYRSECVSVISQNYDEFMKILLEEMQPKVICGDLKMCPAPKVPNDAECDVCTLAMKYLDDTLAKNATQAEIEAALEKVCSILPTSYKTECDNMITTYGPLIFQLLIQELKPSEICAKLGLCPASVKHVAPQVPNDAECDVCTLAMKYLDDTLAKNATQAEIEAALEKVCSILPTSYKTECDNMITTYGPLIFQLLIQELKPSEICAKLGLCPASVKHVAPKVSNNAECEICTIVMDYVDHILAENATEAEIEAALEKVCSLVPSLYKSECDDLVKKYTNEFIQLLLRLQPSAICRALDLCTSTTIPVAPQPLKFPGECLVCDLIMKELDKILSEESTEKEILAAVMSVCNIIPGKYKSDCDLYIKDYGPGVIAILVQDFAPKRVCARLHMCASTQQTNKPVMKLHVGGEKCAICKAVITELDQFLDDNRTEAAVEHALGLICARLPTALQSECQEFVDEFTPMIFKYIDNIGDPSFVCQHLHLCPTELKQSQILGGDKCTYGPSYWCRDMETAKACRAVQHCVDHVW